MNKFSLVLVSVLFVALGVLNIVGCGGGIEAEYVSDEATVDQTEPTVEQPVAEKPATEPEKPVTEPVEEPVVEPEETADCQDLDGDGYCSPSDCNDSPDDADLDGIVDGYFVHTGATELCDWIDNDCDGKTDEELELFKVYIDNDNDGYGDSNAVKNCGYLGFAEEPGDCDDSDSDIHPGAKDEPGDGVDSDCDDETAPVQEDPASDLSISIRYSYAAHRVLSYQVFTSENEVGNWWTKDTAVVSDSSGLSASASFDDAKNFLGIRFNVAEGDPASSWLCMGNLRTASILENVSIHVVFLGGVYTTEDVETWSDPNGAGCSAFILF